jgi:phenylacetate-CoA ligase
MNNNIAKYLVYYPIQILRGERVKEYIPQVSPVERFTPAEINTIQEEKLRKIVTHACKNIPYYSDLFAANSIKPEDIRCYSDLERIPVLTKRTILDNEEKLINPSFTGKMRIRKTGGSTGMTLHFKKEQDATALNDAIMYRCYSWYGIDIGDKQARFWGVPVTAKLRWKEQLKDFILNRIRISAFDISESACMEQYERIKKFKPDYFYGYTTAIYGFCLFMDKLGIDLNSLGLKAVICTAEKMYDHHTLLFKKVFKCPVVDEYGSTENGILAFQCSQGNMHLMADHMCVEFLDENDRQVRPGELGRIVVTDLASYAMPLLRYDIGDMGRPSDKTCSCGINLPLMEIVEGRKEDFIRTKEGKLIHAAYLCYTLKDDTVHEFKMYQKDIDTLHVQIVKAPSFSAESEAQLDRKLRTALGDGIKITFQYLERIPREVSGKLRYFVSEIRANNVGER